MIAVPRHHLSPPILFSLRVTSTRLHAHSTPAGTTTGVIYKARFLFLLMTEVLFLPSKDLVIVKLHLKKTRDSASMHLAIVAWSQVQQRQVTGESIANPLGPTKIEKNRYNVKSIGEVMKFLVVIRFLFVAAWKGHMSMMNRICLLASSENFLKTL